MCVSLFACVLSLLLLLLHVLYKFIDKLLLEMKAVIIIQQSLFQIQIVVVKAYYCITTNRFSL